MKKPSMTKRIIATVTGIIMVIGLLPVSAAVAAEADSVTVEASCDAFYGTVTGSGSYEVGDTVTLTATPIEGTVFMYWLDADAQFDESPTEEELDAAIASYDAEYTFTATEDVALEAVFSVPNEISIFPMLITGTDDESLLAAEMVNQEGDFDAILLGAEPISLPGEIIEQIVTIEDTQYAFVGFIVYGYDEATDTVTVELKEAVTIDAMPLYGSAEYWDWFTPISDGVYAAYAEHTSEGDDDGGDGQQPPNDPQPPDDSQQPDPRSPQTGDNTNLLMWFALLFVSGAGIFALTFFNRKRNAISER